jgi:predicted extracellular nuclease
MLLAWTLALLPAACARDDRIVAVFWNVENLYDASDDSDCDDDEFTPGSSLHWTEDVYHRKLSQLAIGIRLLDGDADAHGARFPDLLGLAEIERRGVIADLLTREFAGSALAIVHEQSPDERGIDVALVYRTDRFTEVSHAALRVNAGRTRDILHVELAAVPGGARLHVLVNHWPSRGSPAADRRAAARVCHARIQEILARDADADVLVMGDFNDEPEDASLARGLGDLVTNLAAPAKAAGLGTTRFQGRWELFDQMLISPGLTRAPGFRLSPEGFRIANDALLRAGNRADAPPRRFVFKDAVDPRGFSDHLPVLVRLELVAPGGAR